MPELAPLDRFEQLVRERRSSHFVDRERAVPVDLVRRLCDLGQWAPCHKRTWPAVYRLVTGDSRAQLGHVAAGVMAARGEGSAKIDKTISKYTRTPAVLVVGSRAGDSPLRTAENRDSVAAAVQTLLLGATAAGLATFWSSCPDGANDAVAAWCGLGPGTHVVGLIYLGWPARSVEAPERPPADFRWLA